MKKRHEALTKGLAARVSLKDAKAAWAKVRTDAGLQATTPAILTPPKGNTKLAKTEQWGLSLLPHRLAGEGNLCPHSTKGCRSVCLNTAGRGRANYVQEARRARTSLLVQHPAAFATLVEREVLRIPEASALRLNVFSDLPWEQIWPVVFTVRPDLQFYDYTKWPVGSRTVPANYHLTYSASELWSDADIVSAVRAGNNVTVVFDLKPKDPMPGSWHGLPVVDGDKSDARYEDPPGVVVGLRSKGDARKAGQGFVRPVPLGAVVSFVRLGERRSNRKAA
jgi:hypothetical protein